MNLFSSALGLAKNSTEESLSLKLLRKLYPDKSDSMLSEALVKGINLHTAACKSAEAFRKNKINQKKAIENLIKEFPDFEEETCKGAFFHGLFVTK